MHIFTWSVIHTVFAFGGLSVVVAYKHSAVKKGQKIWFRKKAIFVQSAASLYHKPYVYEVTLTEHNLY